MNILVSTDSELLPSKQQFAVALSAVYIAVYDKEKRQIWIIPPGCGKTRIICCVAMLYTEMKGRRCKKVLIIFANKLMLDREAELYKQAKALMGELEVQTLTAADFKNQA